MSTASDLKNNIIAAFWTDTKAKNKHKELALKIGKLIWRFTKLAIYLFLIVLGLWGCVSLYSEPSVMESVNIGQGFEFGMPLHVVAGHPYAYQYENTYIGTGTYTMYTWSQWTNAYGPFYGFFVYPGCALVILIMWGCASWWGGLNALLGIFVLLLLIRILSVVVSVRSALMSERMQELNVQVQAIKEKYKGAKDAQSRQLQQQEIQQLYAKNKVKQWIMLEQMCITLPVFLVVYRVVTILRPFKYTNLFNIWNLSDSPYNQIFHQFVNNGWLYLILLIIVIPIMIVSQVLPQILTKKRKKTNYNKAVLLAQLTTKKKSNGFSSAMMWVFPIISVVFAIFLPAGVAVYWVINAIFSIIQTLIVHKFIMRRRHSVHSEKSKRERYGLNF